MYFVYVRFYDLCLLINHSVRAFFYDGFSQYIMCMIVGYDRRGSFFH